MWLQLSPWLDTTALCSGDESDGKMFDGGGEVRRAQKKGKNPVFGNLTTVLASSCR